MANVELRKRAEAQSLSRMGTAILKGIKLGVNWLPEGDDNLGFTAMGINPIVNVAWYHPTFFDGLTDTEQSTLRMGVFAHETLHQCFTDFKETNKICDKMSRAEAAIFMQFANTLEDPAIEYFAHNVMGGRLLEALEFSIQTIYKRSPGITDARDPFSQLIGALIFFGDMGIVKGEFTFPEAKEYFYKVAPVYNKGITCPYAKKRLKYAKECMEITRPLWEESVKNEELMEKLIKELMEALEKSGLHLFEDAEDGMEGSPSAASDRRDKASKSMMKKSGKGSDSEKGDKDESGSEDSTDSSDPKSGSSGSSDDSSDKDGSRSSSSGDSSDSSSDSSDSGDDSDSCIKSEDEANEIANDTYEIDESTLDSIEESIKKEAERITKAENAEGKGGSDSDLKNYEINSSICCKSATCKNEYAKGHGSTRISDLYRDMVSMYQREIKNLTKSLDDLFKSDMESDIRATSGSYNIKRGSIGCSARIFDKKRDPENLKDAEIFLCVDLSGSMGCGTRIADARKASIVFAEALTKLKIPYYIMGFSADSQGYNANHIHFVDWNNRKKNRETLATMHAGGNNFDGYSIRYATQVLKDRPASKKILFVISDGEPACCTYRRDSDGISDTINAIKEARKSGITTFGIAIGNGCSPRVLQDMYGADFIHVDESSLTATLGKKLKKALKH